MKFFKIFLFLFLFFSQKNLSISSIKKEKLKDYKIITDLEKEKLKGKVKSKIIEITYYTKDGKIEKISLEKTSYNENGFKTKVINNNNILLESDFITTFEYDENNLLTSTVNDKKNSVHSYKIDENGYLVENIKFLQKQMPLENPGKIEKDYYNKKSLKAMEVLLEGEGEVRTNYYDKNGFQVKEFVTFSGLPIANATYTYDANSNILLITNLDKPYYTMKYVYYPNSEIVKQQLVNFNAIQETSFIFDKNGHVIEQKITNLFKNKIDFHYTFKNKVDPVGNLSEGLRYNNLLKYNDALTKITYEYY